MWSSTEETQCRHSYTKINLQSGPHLAKDYMNSLQVYRII